MHVLSYCQQALESYTWRHDNILLKIFNFIKENVRDQTVELFCDVVTDEEGRNFVLNGNRDTIPGDIVVTSLRPDICIVDRKSKHVILLELTVPYESNVISAQDRKTQRYAPLVADIESNGFRCSLYTVEIGARGIIPAGTMKLMKTITGASKSRVKLCLTDISRAVVQCSYLIFLRRNNPIAPTFIIS